MADRAINSQINNVEYKDKNGNVIRRSIGHLPSFYRTDANERFLSSTIDPLIQPGSLQRLDGFVGHEYAYTRNPKDKYISATSTDRKNYQLEPTVTYTDKDTASVNPEDRVKFTGTYDDYLNQIKFFGGLTDNQDRLNKEKVYAWNPAIDYDKLVNYREYYWLPEGPNPISVNTIGTGTTTEIKVANNAAGAYTFSTRAGTDNPTLKLYRGNTYKFIVNASGHPFYIMTEPFKTGIDVDGSTSVIYSTGVTNNGTDKGTVEFVVPTDAPDVLYYQCGNHTAMHGVLTIETIDSSTNIDVENQIEGAKNYTTSAGVKLSNGMKLKFGTNVTNASKYSTKQFYVEGVGDSITLTDSADLITPESYATETTETYDSVPYDDRPYQISFYRPVDKDYITINRSSIDQNAWSRYNRWYHKSVLETTATANGTTANLLEEDRAKRPIIEFDSGLALYNHGTVAKKSVTLVDTVTTDVFSNVVNKTGYIVDGVSLAEGMRVLFTADTDTLVKNRIYVVNFVTVGSSKVIALTSPADSSPADKECVFIELGTSNQGKTYFYDSTDKTWSVGQTKTALNQEPLFDLFDSDHVSFSNTTTYPTTTFTGAKVFNFATSTSSVTDTVLGKKIKYKTINNVGDIVFESDLSSGSFTYTSGNDSVTKKYGSGHLHYTTGLTTHNSKSGWIEREEESKQRVIKTIVVTSDEKKLFPIDVYKNSKSLTDLEVSVDVNHVRKDLTTDYTLADGTVNKYVSFNKDLAVNDIVKISTYSATKKVDGIGLYEVPENLSVNPFNAQLSEFTFGEILNHVHDIQEKNIDVVGTIPGSSNLRDLPEVRTKGGTILQHTGALPQGIFNLIDQNANTIRGLEYASLEYEKFRDSFISKSFGKNFTGDVPEFVDEILTAIADEKNQTFPFFYEDMVGFGKNVSTKTYTVQDSSEVDYAIDSVHKMNTVSNRAVYVYVNDVQLTHNTDYTFNTTDDSVTISKTLVVGDIIKIKDYADTTGSFIPPTPTKLGMYPKFKPELVTDNTYRTSKSVIVGHDGSRTIAYGDYRDDLLLELEKRIYNNLKTAYDSSLLAETDVRPSVFKSTGYTNTEFNSVLSLDFYNWAGKNNVSWQNNTTYKEDDAFTWNYNLARDSVSNNLSPGYWRGIYKLYYDTDRPHTHPWEMLGYSEKPSTWETHYGPAPYTAGNSVLWDDLEAGYDRTQSTTITRYIRTGLSNYLPVDDNGNLKSPIAAKLIQGDTTRNRNRNWEFGDQSPSETAWRRSPSYAFSVAKVLALTNPAKFFGLFLDNAKLTRNTANNLVDSTTEVRQTLADTKYHLETETNEVTGVTTRYMTAGYQPWVVNYLIKNNLDPATFYYDKMKNLNVQLAYKLGGFTDKENIKVLTDSTSPASAGGTQFVPDENYKILFRTSNPVNSFNYSGVLIELNTDTTTDGSTLQGGYKVIGYNALQPFFKVFEPMKSGSTKIKVGTAEAVIYKNYRNTVKTVTYGTVFTTVQEVIDFLVGYGKYLESQGFVFDKFSNEIKEVNNWETSAKEFLYWTTQGWSSGAAITLSAGADGFNLVTQNSIIARLTDVKGQYSVLDAGGRIIGVKDISTKRAGTTFNISTKNPELGIFNIQMNAVQKEHMIIFDNKTSFNDVILELPTGFRQQRLKLIGWKTGNWNGDYYAPGFIFDEAQVSLWLANTNYEIGDTVEYDANFYVAKVNHNSGSEFDFAKWQIKDAKPVPQLIPNFDYKIDQFNDFYNLETNNFNQGQQSLAQHLIGYQSRPYLENLFANDISQYKFYQGFIRDKGTSTAIDRLLKAQFNDENLDIETYQEWMIRVGEFGNADGVKSLQIKMPDNTFLHNTQSIELLPNGGTKSYDRSVGVEDNELYDKPLEYTASATFDRYDYTKPGFDRDVIQKFKTAGWVRPQDVQHTAYDIDDITNLDVNQIQNNDLIWIARKEDTNWDVLRISPADITVKSVRSFNNDTQMIIEFSLPHSFVKNDYMAIRNSQFANLNGVYKIQEIQDGTSVLINFENASSLGTPNSVLADESTLDTYGDVYKTVSVRVASMNNVNDRLSYREYKDADDINKIKGDRVFAENVGGTYKTYEKVDPYAINYLGSPDSDVNQDFGYRCLSREDGRTLVVSAPDKGQGTVHFYFARDVSGDNPIYTIQNSFTMTDNNDNTSRLGESLSISSDENFVVAGAPYANAMALDGSTRQIDSGLIKIYLWGSSTLNYSLLTTLTSPFDGSSNLENANFGWSHAIAEQGTASTRSTTDKYLFVSAPGYQSDTGVVHMYTWGVGADGSTYDTWTQQTSIQSNDPDAGQRFGHRLKVNDNGDILAVSSKAPGKAGKVEIFVRSSVTNDDSTQYIWTHRQTLEGATADGSTKNTAFGDDIAMSKDGTALFVTAPGHDKTNQEDAGAIYYYKWNADGSTNTYTLQQTLVAPDTQTNMRFGSSISTNIAGTRVAIGAENLGNAREMKFDSGATTFDLQDTLVVDLNIGSGGVYTATLYDTQFVIDDRIVTTHVSANDDFGTGVFMAENGVLVGAPQDTSESGRSEDGSLTVFKLKTANSYAWKELVSEKALIDNRKIKSAFIFDRSSNKIIDYIDYYDPIKGRILGVADREINYKTEWDPAVYNVGSAEVSVNANIPWGEEHIGEVWWDLSRAKWIWYEQSDQEYKTQNWGKLFPGASIDIYEWVESRLAPADWNNVADTTGGISQGISGIPKYADNTVFTTKQKYDPASGGFVNFYYYWVRNSVILPDPGKSVVTRKSTTAYVSNIITNPALGGFKYFAVTDTDKLLTFNIKNTLANDSVVLNVDYSNNVESGDNHSVWKLFSEGDPTEVPTTKVENKWWDSLIGVDTEGNNVPDLDLPLNRRYGNKIRPRQSWYINRYDALKQIIDYSNSVMKKYELANTINYTNLNANDPEPTEGSGEWDATVDTYADLTYINTADLSGTVNYLVKADEENSNGFWAIYQWDGATFNRTKIQTFKTSAFYSLSDWYKTDGDMTHDENTVVDAQVTYEYQLDTLDLAVGKHAKVTNADTGGWKLFMKTTTGWEKVGVENGTIQFSKKLYDNTIDDIGFAGDDAFDDNFYDQEPTQELRKILTALRDNIFINELKVEYNNLFFIGLRKVLEEQLYVDWMFKTSFLNVKNNFRELTQRKTYTTGADSYVQEYINEVKPFHTKLREYKVGYRKTETQDGLFTDFDNPPFYDSTTGKIRKIDVDGPADATRLTEYPYKIWNNNHKKSVKTLTITNAGSGYTTAPTVTFTGGTTGTTGPFQILGRSNSGTTSGTYGYFYPLFTDQHKANIYDKQNGGAGASHSHTFEEYSGLTFYMPTGSMNHGISTKSFAFKMYTESTATQATAEAVVQGGQVTRITLLTAGAGYDTTPNVILTGGAADGSTPTDTAKVYANLGNDLVRDIDVTLKFDRVDQGATVFEWAKSTAYAYGSLVRHNNELYRVTTAFTSGTKFTDNEGDLTKVKGDEEWLTAAGRTLGMYTPNAGMAGNDLTQLMEGIDYGGVQITGALFSNEQGWDKSPWYNRPWDAYGSTKVKTFYGDGSTATYTFDTAPLATDVYTVYYDGTRQTTDVFRGDGSTTTFTFTAAAADGVKVELIPFDEDKVLTPTDDRTLDTLLSGGLFNTAIGLAPSDIIQDGDAFITPETSYAPEETVPGQIFDTLDIKVYTAPLSGVPFIVDSSYLTDGSTATFAIGQKPATQAGVFVSLDGVPQNSISNTDSSLIYTVDTAAQTVTFTNTPATGKVVNIKSFAVSGENYVLLNTFTGDGSTTAFVTGARDTYQLDSAQPQLFVTVDGQPTTDYTTTESNKRITINFSTAPAAGQAIQIAGFNQDPSTRAFNQIIREDIKVSSLSQPYTLDYPAGTIGPFAGLTIVQYNGTQLRGPDNTYYGADGSTYSFGVASGLSDGSTVDPSKTITSNTQIEVYVNGTKKFLNTDYTVDISGQTVDFLTPPVEGDVIAITTLVDNHYKIVGNDLVFNETQLTTDGISISGNISVTTFNNATGSKIRREVLEGRTTGELFLNNEPLNGDYVFVTLNGTRSLVQGFDFTVVGNKITVSGVALTSSDRLDIMYFAVESNTNATGFRIFKDMLNRTFYKRISQTNTTRLTVALDSSDLEITVADGTVLTEPDPSVNMPGVIFIDKERIEYFTKSGNTLGRLKRGTLGTGIKSHASGASVVDAGGLQTVPYADTITTKTYTGDGSTVQFATTHAPSREEDLDIFIGGQRLLFKHETEDSTLVRGYSVDGSTAFVTLTTAPANGTQVKIVQKRGNTWYTAGATTAADGNGLSRSTTIQAKFIAGEPTNAPE